MKNKDKNNKDKKNKNTDNTKLIEKINNNL